MFNLINNASFYDSINDIIDYDEDLIKPSLIDALFILSPLKLFIKDFVNDFNELTLEQNKRNENFIFSLFHRISIIDLFEKMFYARINMKFKSFIIIFDL